MNAAAHSGPSVAAMIDLIRTRTGLVFPDTRRSDVEAGFRKIMTAAGSTDPEQSLGRLREDGALFDELVSELTIGETYFFREPAHFAFIRETIVDEVRRLRGPEHVLRAWSAGCASGEEPYSLAILFEEMGLAGRTHVLATDISRPALARARTAVYSPWSLRGEGARLIGPYVRRSGSRFVLADRLRRRVTFAYLNLAQDSYPAQVTQTAGVDLILCRNVLIYLDAGTIRDVARRFHGSLADGGFLIAGSSDPPLADHAPFERQTTDAGIIYRKVAPSARRRPAPPVAFAVVQPPAEAPASDHAVIAAPPPSAATEAIPPVPPADPLDEARQAFAAGDNAYVVELTMPALAIDVHAATLCVRGMANLGDTEAAARVAGDAAAHHPASPDIGFLLAVLLMNLNRYGDADRTLRRVLYLDRSLAAAHFAHGMTLRRLGNPRGALRAYRNARSLAARRPREEIVPHFDGAHAGGLADAAALQILSLETLVEART